MHVDHYVCDGCDKRINRSHLVLQQDSSRGGPGGVFTTVSMTGGIRRHDFCDIECLHRWATRHAEAAA